MKVGRGIALTVLALTLLSAPAPAQILTPTEPGLPGTPGAPVPPATPSGPLLGPTTPGIGPARGQTVFDRPRPDYDPIGVRLGSFFLYPRGELAELYNDNIFATEKGTHSDFITVISPGAELISNWTSHQIDLKAGASVGTYDRYSSENYGDYFFSGAGRYDFSRNFSAFGSLRFEHLHEERDDPNAPATAAFPVEFDAYSAEIGISQHGLRIGYDAIFDFHREDYSNVVATNGSIIDNQVRNLNVFAPSLRVSYEFQPNYYAFIRGAGSLQSYDNSEGGNPANPNRNSNGWRFDAGLRLDLTGVTYAEAYVGYLTQDYDDPLLGSIQGVDAGTRLVWNVTTLTSIIANGNREVKDTNTTVVSGNSPGYLRSNLSLEVQHELLRNLLLNIAGIYENDDYKGINRTDNEFDGSVGARFLLNNNVYIGASYTFTRRDSSGSSACCQFSRDLVMLRLTGQL
jgi:hypothetical protein